MMVAGENIIFRTFRVNYNAIVLVEIYNDIGRFSIDRFALRR